MRSKSRSKKQTIGEIVESIQKTRSKAKKLQILKDNNTRPLRALLLLAFDDKLIWRIPEGVPEYDRPDLEHGRGLVHLSYEFKKLYVYTNNDNTERSKLQTVKLERKFLKLLQALDNHEAKLLVSIKDRNVKGITKSLFLEAFPELIDENGNALYSKC